MKRVTMIAMLLCAVASMAVAAAPSQDGKNLSAMFGYSAFYLPDSKQPYVETYLNFNASSLTFVPGEDGKYSATVEVTLVVRRDDTVAYVKKYDLHSPQTSNAELHNFTFFDLQRFALANGIYDLQLTLRDKGSDKPPYVMNDRLVVYFPSGNASMSNIQLMSSATPTEQANMLSRNGFDMVPYVDDFVPATIAQLHPYVEVYHLDKELGSDSYVVYFSIEQKETERRIAAYDTFVRRATKENDAVYGTIDIASLIPGLAGKGYISIKEMTSGKLIKSTDLELTKLKDLPAKAPGYQKKLMQLLFNDGQQVRMKDIGEKPNEFGKITKSLTKHFTGKRKLTSLHWSFWLYIPLAIVGTLALGFDSVVSSFDTDLLACAAMLFGLPFLFAVFARKDAKRQDLIRSSMRRVFFFLLKAVAMLALWFIFSIIIDYGAPLDLWGVLVVYVVCFLLSELAGRFEVDTEYRVQMMGRLLGFKEFIDTAEKQRLEQLQADDPQYFYKVLPYAMVFGLSKKWASLFKDINVEKPVWYDSASPLYGYDLTQNLTHNFYSTASNAISTISHDSSSGSSGGGGGYSGGGGGGGGGGSW